VRLHGTSCPYLIWQSGFFSIRQMQAGLIQSARASWLPQTRRYGALRRRESRRLCRPMWGSVNSQTKQAISEKRKLRPLLTRPLLTAGDPLCLCGNRPGLMNGFVLRVGRNRSEDQHESQSQEEARAARHGTPPLGEDSESYIALSAAMSSAPSMPNSDNYIITYEVDQLLIRLATSSGN